MRLNRILAIIICSLACIIPIHADELSELISIISGGSGVESGVSQVATGGFQVSTGGFQVESGDYFDAIAGIMTEDGAFDFIINSVKDVPSASAFDSGRSSRYDTWTMNVVPSALKFYRPVPGIITSRYGWREKFKRVHHGIDLSLNMGDTVRAAMSGSVRKVGYDHDGYGHYVVLTHPNGMETLYGHLQAPLAVVGQIVHIGMPLGLGGSTGNSTGPHLHFETRLNGKPLDPMAFFDFNSKSMYQDPEDAAINIAGQNANKMMTATSGTSIAHKRTYVVRMGDTPASIAGRAGISVMKLCRLNMISEFEPLQIGRMLKLK